jgi:hypothetical protein
VFIGDPAKPAVVLITDTTKLNIVSGIAENVDPGKHRVVLWSLDDYYTRIASGPICSDSSWSFGTTTKGSPIVLVVDATYDMYEYTRIEHPALMKGVIAWDALPSRDLPTGSIGDPAQHPEIRIVGLTPGSSAIRGTVNNVNARKVRVVLYAKTDYYYIQPSIASPYTKVCVGNGRWSSTTYTWDRMVALLVDSTFVAQSKLSSHPSRMSGVVSWDEYPEPCTPFGIVGSLASPPEISIVGLTYGSATVRGTANNIDVARTRVVLYAQRQSFQWYVQPYAVSPYTEICGGSGSWTNSVYSWDRVVALLVDTSFVPKSTLTTHPALSANVRAWDEYPVRCAPIGIIGDLSFPPIIRITTAASSRIEGTVLNVDASKLRVVLWAKTNMWYVQPWIAYPYTDICGGSGTWGSYTHGWNTIAALLVDNTYSPGATRYGDPWSDRGVVAWTKYP